MQARIFKTQESLERLCSKELLWKVQHEDMLKLTSLVVKRLREIKTYKYEVWGLKLKKQGLEYEPSENELSDVE